MDDKLLSYESKGQSTILLIGRVLMALNFFWLGYSKWASWDTVFIYMDSFDLPYTAQILQASIGIEIIGGFLILLGVYSRQTATVLIVYLITTTLMFNRFWTAPETEKFLQQVLFFKQLTVIGCLEIFRTTGAGRFSFYD